MAKATLLGFLICASVLVNCGTHAFADDRPNILFIFTDDHALKALSAYGGPFAKIAPTPNLDRIAAEGMRFEHCLVTNSICAPSRAVILTGKYSHLNGQRTNGDRFDGTQQTAPKLLRQAGYTTAIIGKWHLKSTPTGFDHYQVLKGQGSYYNPILLTNGETVRHTGYVTDLITEQAIQWLGDYITTDSSNASKEAKRKPFFLMFQHKAPHGRWEPAARHLKLFADQDLPEPDSLFDDYANRSVAPAGHKMGIAKHLGDHRLMFKYSSKLTPEQREKLDAYYKPRNEAFVKANLIGKARTRWQYQRYIKNYLRCVKGVDESVGKVLEFLDENDLAKNTVVIYSSDQGFWLGEHGWFDKRWMYDESLHTPLLVRWPGKVKPGGVNKDMVSNIDFAQTFLDIADAKAPSDMQGKSLVPVLKGKTPDDWRKIFYYHYYEGGGHGVPIHYGVTDGNYKLIRFPDKELDVWEFYDLKKDKHEMRSEYENTKYEDVVGKMKKELKRLRKDLKVAG
jgi:arylsulfatase A-like enzyme